MMTTDGLLVALNAADDVSRLKVVIYVLEHTDRRSYIYSGSIDDVARGARVSYSTAAKAMQLCQTAGLIKKVDRCRWHVEDSVFEGSADEEPFVMIRNYIK